MSKATATKSTKSAKSSKKIIEKAPTFPQASSLNTLCSVMSLMNGSRGVSTSYICDIMGFSNQRQSNYYTAALVYLGLATCKGAGNVFKYQLTATGVRVKRMKQKNRLAYIADVTSRTPVFSKTYTGKRITKRDIERSGLKNMSEGTLERRMSTVKSWDRQLKQTMSA